MVKERENKRVLSGCGRWLLNLSVGTYPMYWNSHFLPRRGGYRRTRPSSFTRWRRHQGEERKRTTQPVQKPYKFILMKVITRVRGWFKHQTTELFTIALQVHDHHVLNDCFLTKQRWKNFWHRTCCFAAKRQKLTLWKVRTGNISNFAKLEKLDF